MDEVPFWVWNKWYIKYFVSLIHLNASYLELNKSKTRTSKRFFECLPGLRKFSAYKIHFRAVSINWCLSWYIQSWSRYFNYLFKNDKSYPSFSTTEKVLRKSLSKARRVDPFNYVYRFCYGTGVFASVNMQEHSGKNIQASPTFPLTSSSERYPASDKLLSLALHSFSNGLFKAMV